MKQLNKLAKNPLIIVIIMIKDLKDLIIELKKMMITTEVVAASTQSFDWWDFIIKLVIAITLWLVLRAYFNFQKRFQYQNLLNSIRNKYLFLSNFQDIDFIRLPNESDDSFFTRLPDAEYSKYLRKEYAYLKNKIMKEYDLKPSEAQKEIDKLYGIKRSKKTKLKNQ